MTGSAPKAASTRTPLETVFRGAVAAEWTRLATVRSTWWSLLVATSLMVLVGATAGHSHDGVGPAPIWQPAQLSVAAAQFAFLLVVLFAVTGEYATGAIRSSLQWVPRRGVLLAARTIVPVGFAVACSLVVAAATNLVTWVFVGGAAEVVAADIAASLGTISLVIAFGGVLTVGIGLFLRSVAGTLTALFLLVLALPIALGNTGVDLLVAISDALPGRAIVSLLVVDEVELAASEIATVMVAWAAASMVAGAWSLIRRDTT